MTQRWGATPEEWLNASLVLDLTSDLLPVVSNPNAKIGEHSKLKQIGKTPSRYNSQGFVGGILDWTAKVSTLDEITAWSKQPDYGICLQCRRVRSIDVDVSDPALAAAIRAKLNQFAIRYRDNSPKFLAAFELRGSYSKRTIKTAHGIIEFLATGQQAVIAGTHPSGARYKWRGGDPSEFISLTEAEFSALWLDLQESFGIEPSTELNTADRKAKLQGAISDDPTAQFLRRNNLVLSQERDGRIHLRCPFEDQHTDQLAGSESATTYFPANTGGYSHGFLKCFHAHCIKRSQQEFLQAIGITAADDFEDRSLRDSTADGEHTRVREPGAGTSSVAPTGKEKRSYVFEPAHVFAQGEAASWIIKGVLPQADLAVVFGESGSGKSFFTLDLACHVARGLPYRGKKTAQGAVAYIAAEGSGGFKNRLKAYAAHHEISLADLPLTVLAAKPNFMRRDNVDAVRDAILALPARPTLIVVDTWAQVTPGANENSGEDMGRAMGHAAQLRAATGSMIVLIHHSGKDATKGARGWSGLRAAADAEFEIVRDPHSPQRVATLTKLRDGGDDVEMGFKLDVVSLGTDSDGDPITSCVVVPTENTGPAAQRPRMLLGDLEHLMLRVLDDIQGLAGEDVKIDDLLVAVVNQRVPPSDGGRDTRKQVAQKTLNRLVEKGQLRFNGGLVERTDSV